MREIEMSLVKGSIAQLWRDSGVRREAFNR